MFASKLLSILEALPTDADNGSCASDTAEEKATMKENENEILSRSNGDKEENSLVFPTKDFLDSNGYVSCKETLACDTKDMDELRKVSDLYGSVLFNVSRSNDDKINASTVEDDSNEALPNIITSRRHGNLFACDMKDRDQQWNTPEFERSIISDFIDEKETESIVSDALLTSGCKFFETDKKLYTVKRAKEYELPELVVCYKESNYNIVKSICMDDSWNNAQPGTYVSIPADEDQHSNTSESADTELSSAGGSKSSVEYENNEEEDTESLSSASGSKSSVEYENNEEEDTESQDGLNPTSQDEVNNDSDMENNEEEDTESQDGLNPTSHDEVNNDADTENNEEEDTKSQDGLNATSQDKVNNDSDSDSFLEDLFLIFGSSGTAKWKHTNRSSEKDSSAKNVMLHPEESGIENSQQSKQPDQIPFEEAVLESQNAVSAVNEANNSVPDTDLLYKSKLGNEAIVFDFNSTKPASASNMDQGVENIPEPRSKSFRDLLLDSQGYLADGEASFSALGPESAQIIHSGRISSSESISDSSTTSSGSFAFPILQSEWISSPVRIGQEIESRHFRKHRSWKQGILCCRF